MCNGRTNINGGGRSCLGVNYLGGKRENNLMVHCGFALGRFSR